MAEGIRIQPRPGLNWRDETVCVTDHARPLPQPKNGRLEDYVPECGFCGVRHYAKTYRIHLYAGAAIVSTTVWERLQALADNPFVYANPVPAPPGQKLTLHAAGMLPPQSVRIRPTVQRMAGAHVLCVTDHRRPLPAPTDGTPLALVQPVCHVCGNQHLAKTYQLQIEADGSVVVSREVWANLQNVGDGTLFTLVEDVPEPLPQIIHPQPAGATRPTLVEKVPQPIFTKG